MSTKAGQSQKAIGDHQLWMFADVSVVSDPKKAERRFTVHLTLEMQDMYNFNPGMQDKASLIPDAANGRFEITGLGHQYLNSGSTTRRFTFFAPLGPVSRPETAGSRPFPGSVPRQGVPTDPYR